MFAVKGLKLVMMLHAHFTHVRSIRFQGDTFESQLLQRLEHTKRETAWMIRVSCGFAVSFELL